MGNYKWRDFEKHAYRRVPIDVTAGGGVFANGSVECALSDNGKVLSGTCQWQTKEWECNKVCVRCVGNRSISFLKQELFVCVGIERRSQRCWRLCLVVRARVRRCVVWPDVNAVVGVDVDRLCVDACAAARFSHCRLLHGCVLLVLFLSCFDTFFCVSQRGIRRTNSITCRKCTSRRLRSATTAARGRGAATRRSGRATATRRPRRRRSCAVCLANASWRCLSADSSATCTLSL